MKRRYLSLRARVFLIFISVVVLIIAAFFVTNRIFWNSIYIRENRKALVETYSELSRMVQSSATTEEELSDAVQKARLRNINFALQGQSEWIFMMQRTIAPVEQDFLMERLQADFLNHNPDEVTVRILQEAENYTLQRVVLGSGDEYLEIFGYMEDPQGNMKKFILSLPLHNIMLASRFSSRTFIWLSLILLIGAGFMVNILTERITEPVVQLTEISKSMSRLDFSKRYTGDQHDEIGVLGNNMNEMSSQLERAFLQLQMANEKLQKDIREKEEVDEMRKDFISNVSHELKTPIALIQGYAEGLRDIAGDDPESTAYYCDVICDEADKMNRMVKKLTTLNQLEFGGEIMTMEPFDIMDMIRSLVRGSKKMQEDHHAEVSVEGPESCMVLGDAFRIEEVVNNYYSNAMNHLEEPYRIDFRLDDLGPNVRISVKNTGENIPEEELPKIWIKFHKVDKARTRAYGGSGIGLAIVKAIMDSHGHEYGVYNVEDGVVFWFELKKAEEQADS
ncbi:MAG: HAMP domain-containing protein [Lachnospiraceae bacterium]|nr:HAMP domain-containing protein [Lachnospiraceae bacterium]